MSNNYYEHQNLESYTDAVLNTEDLNKLYQLKLEVTQNLNAAHRESNNAQTRGDKHEAIGKVAECSALLEVINSKIDDVKNTGARINYNFRMAAKTVLKPETYKKIMELSQFRGQVKDNREQLRKNKME